MLKGENRRAQQIRWAIQEKSSEKKKNRALRQPKGKRETVDILSEEDRT